MSDEDIYPDLSELFAEKMKARRARAALSVQEKLAALDRLRREVAPLRLARLDRAAVKAFENRKDA